MITWLEHSRIFQGCVLWGVQLPFILISLPIVGTRDGEIMFMNYEASDITITGSQQPKSWTVSAWTRPLRYLWSGSLIFIVLFWDIVEILPSSFLTSIAFQYQELTEYIASFVATQYDEIKMCSWFILLYNVTYSVGHFRRAGWAQLIDS